MMARLNDPGFERLEKWLRVQVSTKGRYPWQCENELQDKLQALLHPCPLEAVSSMAQDFFDRHVHFKFTSGSFTTRNTDYGRPPEAMVQTGGRYLPSVNVISH